MNSASASPTRKPIIGLAGGIGSGKSFVAAEFSRLGCVVIDSDKLNHEVLRRPEVLSQLHRWWGDAVVAADGGPNRSEIAKIVFPNPSERAKIESLTHPLIRERRRDIILAVELDSAVPAIVLDSPLLFESRLDRECDSVVFIDASEPTRLERLRSTRNWSAEELHRRELAQLPLSEKRNRADFVLNNNGSLEDLRNGVSDVLAKVRARHSLRS